MSAIVLYLLCFHSKYLIITLQHAAELEQKQNESENKKLLGEIVKYSNVIQVSDIYFHVKERNVLSLICIWYKCQPALKLGTTIVCSLVRIIQTV